MNYIQQVTLKNGTVVYSVAFDQLDNMDISQEEYARARLEIVKGQAKQNILYVTNKKRKQLNNNAALE